MTGLTAILAAFLRDKTQRLPCRLFGLREVQARDCLGRRGVGQRTATAHRPMASQTLRRVTPPQLRAGRVAYLVPRMMPPNSKG
jgi:hypothetical protein